VPTIEQVRQRLARHEPVTLPEPAERQAAVAVVLRDDDGPVEVLFIERASREGDPWSGHMAFPGGRVDDADPTPLAAAARETSEEVGLSLAGAEYMGRLDDIQGLPRSASQLVVSAYVFHVRGPEPLVPNREVREAFWFPLRSLLDPELHVEYAVQRGSRTHFPGILVGEPERHVVWGLTYRFLEGFFEVIGRPLPQRWHFGQED
jgi:8-oxo-dGTP pyrophosphatase MutT (NUDIX family)